MLSRSFKRQACRLSSVSKRVAVPSGIKMSSAIAVRHFSYANSGFGKEFPRLGNNMVSMKRFASKTVKVPDMAESITEGTLAGFTKEVGDYVRQDETIATIETDKIDVEVNSPCDGKITAFLANPEDNVEVGQDLVTIEEGEVPADADKPKEEPKSEEPKEEEPKKEEPKKEEPKKEEPKKEAAKPKEPKEKSSKPAKEQPKKAEEEPATFTQFSRHEERVKMNRMRLRIAQRLKESQNTAASLTTFNEVDMSNLMEMRKRYKDEFLEKTGIKFGFMGAFSKASTLAMKEIPAVNASIENDDTIVYRDYTDISVAVATPKGLVTPVVRNAESLSILGIEKAIHDLGKKARDGKLTLEDMAGGTFTISNGGVFGSLYGTPIINLPQTAVLGLHGVKQRPVTVNGEVVSRPMMYLALTYDHRVLDGREAVTFLVRIKELIEDPRKMLLLQ